MTQLRTLDFLNYHKGTPTQALDSLKEQFGIKYSIWANELVVLNYCQIESKKDSKLAMECRSLVVTLPKLKHDLGEPYGYADFELVSRSFDRFFNYGESGCPDVPISELTAYEKVDGSLIGVFYWKGKWLYRTRSVIMPEQVINGNVEEVTWKDMLDSQIDEVPNGLGKYDTAILELTCRHNRVVTIYASEPVLTLLAVRDLSDECAYVAPECLDEYAKRNGWDRPEKFTFDSFAHCEFAAKSLRDLQEGYVMYNKLGVPVMKLKNPAYVAAHHLRGEGLTPKRVLDLLIMNEMDEYLSIFPEDAEIFLPYVHAYDTMWHVMSTVVDVTAGLEINQKQYAMIVKDLSFASIMFSIRNRGDSLQEAWEGLTPKSKYGIIQSYLIKEGE